MMVSANRFRSIGWIALLLVCGALVMVMAFRVNALRSQVHRTELKIISLRKEKLYLETEVETRANQQQLKLWNDVEFGYVAPTASQYIGSERQLAAFAKPEGPDAPEPIRVASADDAIAAEAAFPSVIAGLAGAGLSGSADLSAPAAQDAAKPAAKPADAQERAAATANLGARLAMVGSPGRAGKEKGGKDKSGKDNSGRDNSGREPVSDKKAALAKVAKDDGARPGKGAKLTDAKSGSKSGASSQPATRKPATRKPAAGKPSAKGSKTAP